MTRPATLLIISIAFVATLLSTSPVSGAQLIVNGGFETCDGTGWTASSPAAAYVPWTASNGPHGGGFNPPFTVSPFQGTCNVWNGVAVLGAGGGTHTLFQQVTLPAGSFAQLAWADRFQSNLADFCGGGNPVCGTHTYRVDITNTSNVVLQNLHLQSNGPGSNLDTNWQSRSANVSAFAGQTIRVRFSSIATVGSDGPGQLDIDAVSLNTATSSQVTLGGRVLSSAGQGLRNAVVTLHDLQGTPRVITTSSFGYFSFDGVEAGRSYVLTVSSKRFTFAPTTISLADEIVDLELVGN